MDGEAKRGSKYLEQQIKDPVEKLVADLNKAREKVSDISPESFMPIFTRRLNEIINSEVSKMSHLALSREFMSEIQALKEQIIKKVKAQLNDEHVSATSVFDGERGERNSNTDNIPEGSPAYADTEIDIDHIIELEEPVDVELEAESKPKNLAEFISNYDFQSNSSIMEEILAIKKDIGEDAVVENNKSLKKDGGIISIRNNEDTYDEELQNIFKILFTQYVKLNNLAGDDHKNWLVNYYDINRTLIINKVEPILYSMYVEKMEQIPDEDVELEGEPDDSALDKVLHTLFKESEREEDAYFVKRKKEEEAKLNSAFEKLEEGVEKAEGDKVEKILKLNGLVIQFYDYIKEIENIKKNLTKALKGANEDDLMNPVLRAFLAEVNKFLYVTKGVSMQDFLESKIRHDGKTELVSLLDEKNDILINALVEEFSENKKFSLEEFNKTIQEISKLISNASDNILISQYLGLLGAINHLQFEENRQIFEKIRRIYDVDVSIVPKKKSRAEEVSVEFDPRIGIRTWWNGNKPEVIEQVPPRNNNIDIDDVGLEPETNDGGELSEVIDRDGDRATEVSEEVLGIPKAEFEYPEQLEELEGLREGESELNESQKELREFIESILLVRNKFLEKDIEEWNTRINALKSRYETEVGIDGLYQDFRERFQFIGRSGEPDFIANKEQIVESLKERINRLLNPSRSRAKGLAIITYTDAENVLNSMNELFRYDPSYYFSPEGEEMLDKKEHLRMLIDQNHQYEESIFKKRIEKFESINGAYTQIKEVEKSLSRELTNLKIELIPLQSKLKDKKTRWKPEEKEELSLRIDTIQKRMQAIEAEMSVLEVINNNFNYLFEKKYLLKNKEGVLEINRELFSQNFSEYYDAIGNIINMIGKSGSIDKAREIGVSRMLSLFSNLKEERKKIVEEKSEVDNFFHQEVSKLLREISRKSIRRMELTIDLEEGQIKDKGFKEFIASKVNLSGGKIYNPWDKIRDIRTNKGLTYPEMLSHLQDKTKRSQFLYLLTNSLEEVKQDEAFLMKILKQKDGLSSEITTGLFDGSFFGEDDEKDLKKLITDLRDETEGTEKLPQDSESNEQEKTVDKAFRENNILKSIEIQEVTDFKTKTHLRWWNEVSKYFKYHALLKSTTDPKEKENIERVIYSMRLDNDLLDKAWGIINTSKPEVEYKGSSEKLIEYSEKILEYIDLISKGKDKTQDRLEMEQQYPFLQEIDKIFKGYYKEHQAIYDAILENVKEKKKVIIKDNKDIGIIIRSENDNSDKKAKLFIFMDERFGKDEGIAKDLWLGLKKEIGSSGFDESGFHKLITKLVYLYRNIKELQKYPKDVRLIFEQGVLIKELPPDIQDALEKRKDKSTRLIKTEEVEREQFIDLLNIINAFDDLSFLQNNVNQTIAAAA